MKNADAKLFRELQQFKSATRLLITGTPLQNNLKELWSLLHFLMPETFLDWEAFEVWFDFSDLQDEEGTAQFIEDKENQTLVSKIHTVLQPMLLRRIKADVAAYLPKKREYVLYAPMTKEQTDLYNVVNNKKIDTRAYLENKVVESLTKAKNASDSSKQSSRQSSRTSSSNSDPTPPPASNAFSLMMRPKNKGSAQPSVAPSTPLSSSRSASKRKTSPNTENFSSKKSAKSSRQSTPSTASRTRGRPRKDPKSYKVDTDVDEDKLDDDAFEEMLVKELQEQEYDSEDTRDTDEIERAVTLELASMFTQYRLGYHQTNTSQNCKSPRRGWETPSCSCGSSATRLTTSITRGHMILNRRLTRALSRPLGKCFYWTDYFLLSSIAAIRS